MKEVRTGLDMDVREELNMFGDPYLVVSNPSVRTIEYEILRKDRSFGLWEIKPKTGPVPSELKGKYTNTAKALQALDTWFRNQKKKYVPVKTVNTED